MLEEILPCIDTFETFWSSLDQLRAGTNMFNSVNSEIPEFHFVKDEEDVLESTMNRLKEVLSQCYTEFEET